MKNKNYTLVTTICVALTIITFKLISGVLPENINENSWITPVISFLSALGFYLLIFKSLMWLYSNHLEDIFFRRNAISGEWFYKLEIKGKEHPRYGICKIVKDGDGISLSGVHYHPKEKIFTSNFSSGMVDVSAPKLHVKYTACGLDEGEVDNTEGMFFLQLDGSPPSRIHGHWSDLIPVRNNGKITLMKIDSDVEGVMKKVGYPVGSSVAEAIFNSELA